MTTPQIEVPPDEGSESALSETELVTRSPEVFATSLGDYLTAWWQRIKGGESGAVPVLVGLVVIVTFFQAERGAFLSDGNIVNLLIEATLYVLIGVAETFALLLSEIDLSIGYGVGIGGFVIAELIAAPVNLPWWLGVLAGIAALSFLGFVQGTLISRLGLPSFIVTLAGQLGFLGIVEVLANADSSAVGGVIQVSQTSPISKLVNSSMSTTLTWAVVIGSVLVFGALALNTNRSRRARGLHTRPLGVTAATIALLAVIGIVLALICNADSSHFGVVEGMPWVFPYVLLIIIAYSWLLSRTRTGRYLYAVGNNKEAARRAGINVKWIITFGFIMSSATAALAAVVYIGQLGSMSTDIDGGQLVLFAVAAAVIGGTTLFGGRGRIVNALLGGLVIATVFNGLAIMGANAEIVNLVTAVVLIAAVSLDATVRRRATR